MQAFYCKLVPPRASFVQDLSASEAATMKQHAAYWQARIDQGTRVFALGLVLDLAAPFGIGIVEATDLAAVHALTEGDPAIQAGIGMHYEIHPMPRGVMHSA